MANNDKARSINGGRRGRGRGVSADEPPVPVLWPRSLTVPMVYQVAAFNLLVPLDCSWWLEDQHRRVRHATSAGRCQPQEHHPPPLQ
jgi:hypothetical protein